MNKPQRGPIDRITLDSERTRKKIKNPDSMDEIVNSNCTVHLERMDTNWYYLGIYGQGDGDKLLLQVSIHAKKGKRITATVYHDEETDGVGGDWFETGEST